ncbi:MAG: LLM class F420-dependent oxidoreductase, partial [Nitrospinae bacterium]|nr:LLM class F420-dependent oxidoreductase [Nitrospinota bacterium]
WSESTAESAVMGNVDECVAQLQAHIDTGVDRLIFVPYKYEKEQVEIVAKEIIPRLRAG